MILCLWDNDEVQFARLLSEILAVGLSGKQERDICASMGVSTVELTGLFERAEEAFERTKLYLKQYDVD